VAFSANGVPDFKMEKWVLDRGSSSSRRKHRFETGVELGVNLDPEVLARGLTQSVSRSARKPRDLAVPGRDLARHPLRDGLPHPAEPPPGSIKAKDRTRTRSFTARVNP